MSTSSNIDKGFFTLDNDMHVYWPRSKFGPAFFTLFLASLFCDVLWSYIGLPDTNFIKITKLVHYFYH